MVVEDVETRHSHNHHVTFGNPYDLPLTTTDPFILTFPNFLMRNSKMNSKIHNLFKVT
jgi:hypothetical protein